MIPILIAALRSGASFALGLLAELADLALVVWQKAGRILATIAAVALACFALVQCGEIKTLRADNLDLQAQRDALTTERDQCRDARDALMQSLDDQNARVAALGAESARRLAEARDALGKAQEGRARAEERARRLMEAPAGVDACARAYSAFEAVKEDIR